MDEGKSIKNNAIDLFRKFGQKKFLLIVVAILLLVVIGCIIILAPSGNTTYAVKTSLKEVFESSELSTSEYTYNSIAKVAIDDSKPAEEDNIKYQVAYKGTVKSGFDFKDIDVFEKENSIFIIIPKIEIKSVEVDTDLEYIFIKQKYDTEHTYVEAYNACCNDLEIKAKKNKSLDSVAIESAIETITAITKPFEKQLKKGKSIQIKYIEEYSSEVK